ncbi:MAG TPA: DUF1223 domain-containing protein [Flavilitoribacter sp.]|nr:DUF1223 domain-containing protein [Flavilitoribacter sp.]HMQ89361.1 DUF1223 domain-containing protein [Flavilitoribacter sp.]
MKIQVITLLTVLLAGAWQSCSPGRTDAKTGKKAVLTAFKPADREPEAAGFAVVELFTSQGCSSCPPADELLKELVNESRENVAALSFHVDYWNRLGWADPYSQAAFSERQQVYAGKLDAGVYTPQMIVNGRHAFVGSRETEARSHIRKALEARPETSIALNLTGEENRTLEYRLSGRTDRLMLNIALISRHLENDVPRGENRGRTLEHVNVVRWFKTVRPRSGEGSVELDFPAGLKSADTGLIVYTQDQDTWAVTGLGLMD